MDALVAEKVMGSIATHLEAQYEEGVTRDGTDGWSGFFCPACGTSASSYGKEPCARRYSTDISAAWEVVEKLERDYAVTIRTWGIWEVFVDTVCYGTADTAPLAICRAALKAVT